MVDMLHLCKVHMTMKQRGYGVEIWKPVVGVNGAQTCTGLKTKPVCSTAYSAVNANSRKFGGILRYDAHIELIQGAYQDKAKRIGS